MMCDPASVIVRTHFVELGALSFTPSGKIARCVILDGFGRAEEHGKPIYATLVAGQEAAKAVLKDLGFRVVARGRNSNTGALINLMVWLPRTCNVVFKKGVAYGMPYCCGGMISCMYNTRVVGIPKLRERVHLFAAPETLNVFTRERFGLKRLAKYPDFSVWVLEEQYAKAKAVEAR